MSNHENEEMLTGGNVSNVYRSGDFLIVIGQQIFMIIKKKKEKRYHPN
ncbi:hypothetical protein [Priestia flexa]|nr:hypothetical protein [Priestia flexa]